MAMRVEVVHSLPGRAQIVEVRLPAGATVRDAVRASGIAGIDLQRVGIFGKRVSADTRLAEGDRVEIYRPLTMDPKEARRARALRR
jgi:putative ubiquitin-RnfH superfamily antitoxin RatB of RatAB toxin-antitoxin module